MKRSAPKHSLSPTHDWGALVNVDKGFQNMQALHDKVSSASLGDDRIAHILCDGPPPQISLNEAASKYAKRAKEWCTNIRNRITVELETLHHSRTFFWTKVGGVAAVGATIVTVIVWIAPRVVPDELEIRSRSVQSVSPAATPTPFAAAKLTPATKQQSTPAAQQSPERTGDLKLSYEDFVEQYHRLDKQPFDQAEFLKFHAGKRVRWSVVYVGCNTEGDQPMIKFRAEKGQFELFCAFAFTDPATKGDVYALRPDQRIEVTGELKLLTKLQLVLNPAEFRLSQSLPVSPSGKTVTPVAPTTNRSVPAERQIENQSPTKTELIPPDEARLEDIEKKYLKMAGRPAEQEAVIEQYDGARISWILTVQHPAKIGADIYLYLKPHKPVDLVSTARFERTNSRRILELREGDLVRIKGVLRADVAKTRFIIEASECQFLPPEDSATK